MSHSSFRVIFEDDNTIRRDNAIFSSLQTFYNLISSSISEDIINMYNGISIVHGSSAAFNQKSFSSVTSSEVFFTEISKMIQIYIQLRFGPIT